jgi:tape measure domain-containing protein
MKQASFALKLIDQLSRPARAMGGSLARLQRQMKAVQKVSGGNGRGLGKRGGGAFATVSAGPSKMQKAMGKQVDKAGSSVSLLATTLGGATVKAAALAAAMAGIGAAFVVKGIAQAAAHAERMTLAFKNLTGSAKGGEQAYQRSIALSKQLGLNLNDVTGQYAKLLAAQFSVGQTETMIKLTADLKAIGATAEDAGSAIRAITQIKAKGRLQAEELLQLNEAGLSSAMVFDQLGKKMGKSLAQVQKAMQAGKVDADIGLAAVEAAILSKVGIKRAGEAGEKLANSTLSGMFDRLKNAPALLFDRIARAAQSALPKMKGLVNQVLTAIESINPKSVGAAFESIIDLARTGITLGLEFGRGFSESFGKITAALKPGDIGRAVVQFRDLGRTFGELTAFAIDAFKWVGRLFSFLNTGPGKAIMVIGGLGYAIGKVTSAVGALTLAFGGTAGAMGTFGLGAATIGKGFAAFGGVIAAVKGSVIAFGGAAVAALSPVLAIAVPLAAAFTAAGAAMAGLLKVTGGWDKLEELGASLAGPKILRQMHRGNGAPAAPIRQPFVPNMHPYAATARAQRPSALVQRDQVSAAPALAAGKSGPTFGNFTINMQVPASRGSSPRSHASAFAEALRTELSGIVGAPSGG